MASHLALEKHWANKHWIYHIQKQPKKQEGEGEAGPESTSRSLSHSLTLLDSL